MTYDLLIKNGQVVDPLNKVNKITDVSIAGGKIVKVADDQDPGEAREVIDAVGLLVTPGIVDSHVHLVPEGAGGISFNMLLRKGVTTALDMSGPIDIFVAEASANGHGVNAGCLHALVPGVDIKEPEAGSAEIGAAIDKVLEKGAFGIKILGGHYPFTPETTGRIIEEAAKRKAYVATHAGTTTNGSNVKGFEESVALANKHPLHMAHANAYCRGQVEDPLMETKRLLDTLVKNPNIVSESYLSVMNGTSAAIDPTTDKVKSAVTCTWIEKRGYTSDKAGVAKAIKDGWCCIYGRIGSEMVYLSPEDGHAYWKSKNTVAWCSFPVNNPTAMLDCATARRPDGTFTVNAISTDGGFIPRNVIMENGLRIAQMRYMELDDVIAKATLYPARMLGLLDKGHLSPGADGDVAVFRPLCGKAEYTIVGGKVCMAAGICQEGPGTIFTSIQGAGALKKIKAAHIVPDTAKSGYIKGHAQL